MAFNAGASSGNLVLIQKQVISVAQAEVTFTSGITGYDNYTLLFTDVTCTVNTQNLLGQFSINGGSSYDSTGNYNNSGYAKIAAGLSSAGGAGESAFILCLYFDNGPTCGNVNFFMLNSSTRPKCMIANYVSNASGQGFINGQSACTYGVNNIVNAFRIFSSSGNITGTFELYGIQN